MDTPKLVLKPSIVNAVFPSLAKNLLYSLIIMVVLFLLQLVFTNVGIMGVIISGFSWVIAWLALAILPLSVQIIILKNTIYYLYDNYIISEFEFVIVRKHSSPYNQITNIQTNISLWDRLCNAGEITLCTAEDKAPNLVLKFIKHPAKVEKLIYNIMHKARKSR